MIAVLHDKERILDLVPGAEWDGKTVWQNGRVYCVPSCPVEIVPDQDIAHLRDPETGVWRGSLSDLVQFTPEEQAALVDRDIGRAISARIHPFAGIEEQLGILRTQVVEIINRLGIEPTPKFAAYNEIAVQEIKAAAKRKEGLNA